MAKRQTTSTRQPAERAAFLNAITDNPADDTPRLVYADWLEEHDDPDRAAFIRHQIERDRLPEVLSPPEYVRLDWLLREEQRLFDARGGEWLAALGLKADAVDFRRGFLEVLETTPAGFARTPARLFSATPIREIRLRQPAKATSPARHWLRPVAESPHIGRLEGLSLAGTGVTAAHLFDLAGNTGLPGIKSVGLSETPHLRGDGVRAVLVGGVFPRLRSLTAWFYTHSIREVEPYALGAADLAGIADSPHMAAVEELDLTGNAIGDEGAEAIAAGSWQLRSLRLVTNAIGPSGVTALARTRNLGGLARLDLARNPIGDAGAEAIASAACLAGLRGLYLSECGIGNRGAYALARSRHLGSLVQLDLGGNQRIGYEAAFALRDRFGKGLDMSPAD